MGGKTLNNFSFFNGWKNMQIICITVVEFVISYFSRSLSLLSC